MIAGPGQVNLAGASRLHGESVGVDSDRMARQPGNESGLIRDGLKVKRKIGLDGGGG